MLFDISELAPTGRHLDVTVEVPDFEWGDAQVVACGAAHLVVDLRRTRRGIECTGRFETRVELSCSRCLARLAYPVAGAVRLFILPGGALGEQFEAMEEDDPDAVDLYPIPGSEIDLGELVREQVDLALPYRVVCADVGGECSREALEALAGDAEEAEAARLERWAELRRFRNRLGRGGGKRGSD
ncbi:MAG: hypothetical protein Kow0062_16990 [Acidobacteriota bacterium]